MHFIFISYSIITVQLKRGVILNFVFLYHVVQLSTKLNEFDPATGGVPLHIALVEQQESIAKQLVTNGCDVNVPDADGHCLLHKAIQRGDEFAATFLIKNNAKVNAVTVTDQVTPLHLAASYKYVCLIMHYTLISTSFHPFLYLYRPRN